MEIAYLADHPEYINLLSEWFSKEWSTEEGGRTVEEWRSRLLQHLNTKIPLTILALNNKVCVGTASLVFHDLASHAHLSPWLSCVYVIPECRNKGIGIYLVKTLIRKAREMGCPKVYAYQFEVLARDFEARYPFLGLKTVEKAKIKNEKVLIMEIDPHSLSSHLTSHERVKTV